MQHRYTEVSHQSWFSRMKGAFQGIIFGVLLFFAAFVLLFWNEGRSVERWKTLQEGRGQVVSLSAEQIDPNYEGKLIHISGLANTEDVLRDPLVGLEVRALRLQRIVEMYQWKESKRTTSKDKLGGGTETETVYSYDKVWSEQHISSRDFKLAEGHQNPQTMPYQSEEQTAHTVRLGAFHLSPALVRRISTFKPLPLESSFPLPEALQGRAVQDGSGLYIGNAPNAPQVGDLRIRFEAVYPVNVSIIAQQSRDSLTSYRSKVGGTIELLQVGQQSPDDMFQQAEEENKMLTWLLRFMGFGMMFFGLSMIFQVLSVTAAVLPFLGKIVATGTGLVSFLLASFLSLLTIALAWLFYRPLLGIALLVGAGLLLFALTGKLWSAKADKSTVPQPPPLP
jgi:hypothetical protein